MGSMHEFGEKMRGKAEQVKGKFNKESGSEIKGGFQEMKGKIRETVADTKLRMQKNRGRRRGT